MTMSNLAEVLESLDSDELYASDESPLTADELETLLGPAPRRRDAQRKRLRLVRFCDNFSGDFQLFRVR